VPLSTRISSPGWRHLWLSDGDIIGAFIDVMNGTNGCRWGFACIRRHQRIPVYTAAARDWVWCVADAVVIGVGACVIAPVVATVGIVLSTSLHLSHQLLDLYCL